MNKIIIKPTYLAKKHFNFINFQTASEVLTFIYNKKLEDTRVKSKTITITLHLSQSMNYYEWGTNDIFMFKSEYKDPLRFFFLYFLHEFRHWYQCKILKISFDDNYNDNGKEYYKCPIEKDARLFSNAMAGSCVQIYNCLEKANRIIEHTKKIDPKFN